MLRPAAVCSLGQRRTGPHALSSQAGGPRPARQLHSPAGGAQRQGRATRTTQPPWRAARYPQAGTARQMPSLWRWQGLPRGCRHRLVHQMVRQRQQGHGNRAAALKPTPPASPWAKSSQRSQQQQPCSWLLAAAQQRRWEQHWSLCPSPTRRQVGHARRSGARAPPTDRRLDKLLEPGCRRLLGARRIPELGGTNAAPATPCQDGLPLQHGQPDRAPRLAQAADAGPVRGHADHVLALLGGRLPPPVAASDWCAWQHSAWSPATNPKARCSCADAGASAHGTSQRCTDHAPGCAAADFIPAAGGASQEAAVVTIQRFLRGFLTRRRWGVLPCQAPEGGCQCTSSQPSCPPPPWRLLQGLRPRPGAAVTKSAGCGCADPAGHVQSEAPAHPGPGGQSGQHCS